MADFDFRRLRMLRELAERGTLAAVATALDYIPSAVSQQLAFLEREAMVRLLQRLRQHHAHPAPTADSHHMKHVVERALGEYVGNGELIAAALVAGYSFKHTEGPNVELGMSARDVRRVGSATSS
jgi:AraC-like DNA-binding protein